MQTEVVAPEKWNQGPAFVTRQVGCGCGAMNVYLLTTSTTTMGGIFRKREVLTHLAPIYILCGQCSQKALLFDPRKHGWDGEQGNSAAAVGEGDAAKFCDTTGAVIVNYSYQGLENYEDAIEEGVEHPEDYFDTFTVYFQKPGADEVVSVVSYECA